MAITSKWYGKAKTKAFNKEIDWVDDDIKVMLCTDDYTPDQDTHEYKDDISGETSGEGYTTGGVSLTNKTLTYNADNNWVKFDADDAEWSNIEVLARYAVIYDNTPEGDANKPLLGYVDFGEELEISAETFRIKWSSYGIFRITVE